MNPQAPNFLSPCAPSPIPMTGRSDIHIRTNSLAHGLCPPAESLLRLKHPAWLDGTLVRRVVSITRALKVVGQAVVHLRDVGRCLPLEDQHADLNPPLARPLLEAVNVNVPSGEQFDDVAIQVLDRGHEVGLAVGSVVAVEFDPMVGDDVLSDFAAFLDRKPRVKKIVNRSVDPTFRRSAKPFPPISRTLGGLGGRRWTAPSAG